MDIDSMTLGELRQIASMFNASLVGDDSHWKVGENYFLRTVTHYLTGRLEKITAQDLVLVDAAWIADTGRFHEFLRTGIASEVEPYPDGVLVIVGRGSLVDGALWHHALPREVK